MLGPGQPGPGKRGRDSPSEHSVNVRLTDVETDDDSDSYTDSEPRFTEEGQLTRLNAETPAKWKRQEKGRPALLLFLTCKWAGGLGK